VSRRRSASALALVAALVLGVVGSSAARADDGELGGYSLLARANPFQITYDSPGLLPVSPIVQVSVPESYATLESGPTGYGLASLTFPGPLIADLGSAIAQEGPKCQPPFAVPTYPLRSEAFFPQGPTDTDATPVPGSRMHAVADGAASSAYSAWGDVSFPTIFQFGSVSGTSSTSGKGDTAVTKARSVVDGFSMLAGAITIDSIVTDITATSTGDVAKTSGTTRVSGAKVGDQKVTIDENGVSVAGTPVGDVAGLLNQLGTGLNEALLQSGISIKLLDHRENKDGGLAERIADGLVIQINYNGRTAPLLSTLLASLPTGSLPSNNATTCAPSSPQGLVNLFKETHIESFALGGATVSSNAAAAFVLPSLDVDTTIPGLPDISSVDNGALTGDLGALGGGALGGGSSNVGASSFNNAGTSTGAFAAGRAIPVAFILLLLALFPVLGVLTRRLADATLAAPVVATCPLESDGDDNG
jgi:hypothetical protein